MFLLARSILSYHANQASDVMRLQATFKPSAYLATMTLKRRVDHLQTSADGSRAYEEVDEVTWCGDAEQRLALRETADARDDKTTGANTAKSILCDCSTLPLLRVSLLSRKRARNCYCFRAEG